MEPFEYSERWTWEQKEEDRKRIVGGSLKAQARLILRDREVGALSARSFMSRVPYRDTVLTIS